jgi:hypothetical protein
MNLLEEGAKSSGQTFEVVLVDRRLEFDDRQILIVERVAARHKDLVVERWAMYRVFERETVGHCGRGPTTQFAIAVVKLGFSTVGEWELGGAEKEDVSRGGSE